MMLFCWLRIANDIGTAIREHKGYISIPKLAPRTI